MNIWEQEIKWFYLLTIDEVKLAVAPCGSSEKNCWGWEGVSDKSLHQLRTAMHHHPQLTIIRTDFLRSVMQGDVVSVDPVSS